MKIASIICANGLGHYRRSIEILERLRLGNFGLEFTVFCEDWQVERTKNWRCAQSFWSSGPRRKSGVVSSGVRWCTDPAALAEVTSKDCLQKLSSFDVIRTADVVLTDNLVEVLEIRPDAVLLGSFLWGEVFQKAYPEEALARQYAERELELLQTHRSSMIGVGAFAMPRVLEQTKFISVGVMAGAGFDETKDIPREGIALLPGATSNVRDAFVQLAQEIGPGFLAPIYLPGELHALMDLGRADYRLFDFSPVAYASVAVVVCRPGMGTISECIATSTPMITVHEANNPEMFHNGEIVESLNIGRNMGTDHSSHTLEKMLDLLAEHNERISAALNKLPKRGYEEAVDWLEARLTQEPRSS